MHEVNLSLAVREMQIARIIKKAYKVQKNRISNLQNRFVVSRLFRARAERFIGMRKSIYLSCNPLADTSIKISIAGPLPTEAACNHFIHYISTATTCSSQKSDTLVLSEFHMLHLPQYFYLLAWSAWGGRYDYECGVNINDTDISKLCGKPYG